MKNETIRHLKDKNGNTYKLKPNDQVEFTQTGDWDDTKTGVFLGYWGDDYKPSIKLVGFVADVREIS